MPDYRILISNLLPYYYQNIVIKYCEQVYERSGKNLFWSIKNSCEFINKLKSQGFRAASRSTYDVLHYILPCPTILLRINLWTSLKEFAKEKVLFILHVRIDMLFLPLKLLNIIIYGLFRKCVKLSPFS